MKKYDYINKAISKLKKGEHKASIEAELFDHIDEKKKRYIDIGYDEQRADEIAEEAMGDADEISEQLFEQEKRRNKRLVDIAVDMVTILMILIVGFIEFTDISSFFSFEIATLAVVFIYINLIYTSVRRKIVNSFITLFGSFVVADKLAVYLPYQSQSFFSDKVVKILLICNIVLSSLNNLIMANKVKHLRYRKKDIIMEKFIRAFELLIAMLLIILMLIVGYNTVSNYQKNIDDTVSQLTYAQEIFVDNIDVIYNSNNRHKTAEELFGKELCSDELEYRDDSDRIVILWYNENENAVEISNNIQNPYFIGKIKNNKTFSHYFIPIYPDVSTLKVNADTKISEMPLPAKIRFSQNDKGTFIRFSYNTEDLNEFDSYDFKDPFALFMYSEELDDFVLVETSFKHERETLTLTTEQVLLLEDAIADNEYYFLNAKSHLYNVSRIKNCKLDDVYRIDMGKFVFNVNKQGNIINSSLNDGESIFAQINKNGARIIIESNNDSYEYTGDEMRARNMTPEGYLSYLNRDDEWYDNIDLSNAEVSQNFDDKYMEMLNKYKSSTKDCKTLEEYIDAFAFVYCGDSRVLNDRFLYESEVIDGYTGDEYYYISLVRQFEKDDDDDDYAQIHMDIMYKPDNELRNLGYSYGWFESSQIGDMVKKIKDSKEYKLLTDREIERVDIYFTGTE